MALVTYLVERMRVTRPTGKTAERNPERLYTVSGVFYSTETDADGKVVRKDKLSIPSKNIDKSDALADGFALDLSAGTLTLPEGKRGRTAAQGLDADSIAAELEALRNPEPEPETIEPEPEKPAKSK